MKKIVNYSLLVSLALAIIGCTQDIDELTPILPAPSPDGSIAINIDGNINQVTTRADASGFCNGDAVGIYAVNYDGETPG